MTGLEYMPNAYGEKKKRTTTRTALSDPRNLQGDLKKPLKNGPRPVEMSARERGRIFHLVMKNYSKPLVEHVRRGCKGNVVLPPPPQNPLYRKWLFSFLTFLLKKGYRPYMVETPIYFIDAKTGRRCKLIPDMVAQSIKDPKKFAVVDHKTGYPAIFSANFARGGSEAFARQLIDREDHVDQVLSYIDVLNGPHHVGHPHGWKNIPPSTMCVEKGFINYATVGRVVSVDETTRILRFQDEGKVLSRRRRGRGAFAPEEDDEDTPTAMQTALAVYKS